MPRKPDLTGEKKRPRVSVLERRLSNPFGEPSASIKFKDTTVAARWFNEDVRNGQVHRAKELGWIPVTVDMIADMDSLGWHDVNPAHEITRGPRGQEVLMWMPKEDRDAIQQAKTDENIRRMKSPNAQQREVLNAFGSEQPDDAEFMERQGMKLHTDIKTNRERIERAPGLE